MTKEVEIQCVRIKFQACPNHGSQIHARKLACPFGYVFRGSKPLTTKNVSRKVMLVQQEQTAEEQTAKCRKSDRECAVETRALETKEQTAKHRKSNRERVVGTRALEKKEQTTKRRKSDAWSILLQHVCTGMVHIQDYQGVSHRLPTHYTCSHH